MKKKLLLVLMLISAVVVMPRVHAAITLGTVSDNTQHDTLQGGSCIADSTDNSNATITCDSATFRILDSNSDNRTAGYAWVGIKVASATGASSYLVTFNGVPDPQDSSVNGDIVDYIGFNAEELKSATDAAQNLVFTYEILWKGSNGETAKQTITIIIVPNNITLQSKDYDTNQKVEWNNAAYQAEVAEVMSDIYSDLEGAVAVAKGIDTSKYTAESVKALEEAIEDAEAFGKDLTKNNQGDVRALTKAITTAIANLVVKGDEPVKPGSTTTDTNKPGEQAPNTFDAGLTYVGLALSAVGASVISIKKLRNN